MIRKRLAAIWVVCAIIVSSILTFSIGTAYLDRRIQSGIENSEVIDRRVDKAFRGLCTILNVSARPYPKPPTQDDPSKPGPTTPYGKELAKYQEEVARRQSEGLAAVHAAQDTYNCKGK